MKKKEVKSVGKKAPAKKMVKKVTSSRVETRDQFTVVLEHLQSDFKMFGEALQLTNEKMDRGFTEVNNRLDRVDDRLDRVESRLDKVEARLDSIEARLVEHDTRIKQLELAIMELIKELRNDTKQKQIDALMLRVSKLEAMLGNK